MEGSFGEKKKIDSHFFLRVPASFRLAVSAMIAMLLRLLPFGLPTGYQPATVDQERISSSSLAEHTESRAGELGERLG